jgi:uncharacterized protein YjbJ (UPF0337 family)
MNKDRVEGKLKDVAGRVQRQAGEWTGDTEQQVKGTAKQAEGKVQNIAGKVKDALKPDKKSKLDDATVADEERTEKRRTA